MWLIILILILAAALGVLGELLEFALWLTAVLVLAVIVIGAIAYGSLKRRAR